MSKTPITEEFKTDLLQMMRELGPQVSTSQIVEAYAEGGDEVAAATVRSALAEMIEDATVIKTGKKRWSRYTPASMADQIEEAPAKKEVEKSESKESDSGSSKEAAPKTFSNVEELFRYALPLMEPLHEYTANDFGHAVLKFATGDTKVSQYAVIRHLPMLVKNKLISARRVNDQGWRFMYSVTAKRTDVYALFGEPDPDPALVQQAIDDLDQATRDDPEQSGDGTVEYDGEPVGDETFSESEADEDDAEDEVGDGDGPATAVVEAEDLDPDNLTAENYVDDEGDDLPDEEDASEENNVVQFSAPATYEKGDLYDGVEIITIAVSDDGRQHLMLASGKFVTLDAKGKPQTGG